MADYLNIAGRVRTTASDGVAMEAQEVKDLNQNKSQQEINADVQTELGDRYTKEETYNREEIEELVDPVNYVSVMATNLTTDVTDLLPAEGATDTIYRVGNWDGTQYDSTMYALYAWNGTTYVCLSIRSSIGEVYDISANHPDGQGNPTPYTNLSAAIGTGGANVPVGIRRGGMSIKFIQGTVQNPNNKYVECFLSKDEWSANEADWEKMNLEEEVSQLGQELSGDKREAALIREYTKGYITRTGDINTSSNNGIICCIPCTKGDVFILSYKAYALTSARAYAIYSTDVVADINAESLISIAAAGTSPNVEYTIEVDSDDAKMLVVTTAKNDGYEVKVERIIHESKFIILNDNIESVEDKSVMKKYAYLFTGTDFFVAYNEFGVEYCYWFKKCMANELFTFYMVGYRNVDRNEPSAMNINSDPSIIPFVITKSSDNIGPVRINGQWVGGNHLIDGVKTAKTDSFSVSVDGKTIDEGSGYGDDVCIDVVNTIYDPLIENGGIFTTPLLKEDVTYKIAKSNIEVSVSHTYMNETLRGITNYYGMQSMFAESHYITPNGGMVEWTPVPNATVVFNKGSYPLFNRFVEKSTSTYMASYLRPLLDGIHDKVSDGSPIFTNSGTKCYHSVVYGYTPFPVIAGDVIQWKGVYTFFKNALVDADDVLVYRGTIDGEDALFISSGSSKTNLSIKLPGDLCGKKMAVIENIGFQDADGGTLFEVGAAGLILNCEGTASMIVLFDSDKPTRLERIVSEQQEYIGNIEGLLAGTDETITIISEGDRAYTAIPSGASRIFTINNIALHAGQKLVIELDSLVSDIFNEYNYYAQGLMTRFATVESTQRRIELNVEEDVISSEIYCSVTGSQWKEGASSLLPVAFGYSVSVITPEVPGLTEKVSKLEEDTAKLEEDTAKLEEDTATVYKKLKTAVSKQRTGVFAVGQNSVVGLGKVTYSYNDLRPMQENYRVTSPNPVFPMVKKSTLQRMYDGDSNMLYLCSSSADKLFYSICPTDTKHIDYSSATQYAVNYFYFASKSAPTTLTKVVLPDYLPGGESNVIGRKKYVFEMSNGDVLLEVENGVQYAGVLRYHNIYKITGLFDITPIDGVITVPSENISLSLSLNFGNRLRISAFMQIAEANPGEIVLAPYGQGITAIIYHSTDYGDTWEAIFCGIVNNETINIVPKAEAEGTSTAYGEWPTAESIISSTPLDWSGTGNNNIHIHGIAYDKWMDRLWVCTGDGSGYPNGVTGIWWTDDWGRTWHRIATRNTTVMDGIETQLMFPMPIEHSVLFGTDGNGDGCWRWSRTTKQDDVVLEPAYNFMGERTALVMVAGRWAKFRDFVLVSFAPDNVNDGDWKNRGGIVATHNGFDFYKIYEDEFTDTTGTDEHAFDTAEIGWSCEIVDCGDKIVLKADKGGIIILDINP